MSDLEFRMGKEAAEPLSFDFLLAGERRARTDIER